MFTRETAVAEEPLEYVMELYEKLNVEEWTRAVSNFSLEDAYVSPDHPITDYIIYQAYAASKNLPIKAILCPSESWYTAARLSALKPDVPIISFTKNDAAFRYMNLLRGVKGYKIASTFDYVNIKQIWKEILRILFKGSISLDDMILIVHSSLEQDTPWMINGMELYRFKNI
jgi:pyruvate kinase